MHSKVPGRVEVKRKVGAGPEVPLGPIVIEVSRTLGSTIQVYSTGVGSSLPAMSVAAARKVWVPAARAENIWVAVQLISTVLSTLQRKVLPASVESTMKVTDGPEIAEGELWIVVLGGVTSGAPSISTPPSMAASGSPGSPSVTGASMPPLGLARQTLSVSHTRSPGQMPPGEQVAPS